MERPAGRKLMLTTLVVLLTTTLSFSANTPGDTAGTWNDNIYEAFISGRMHVWEETLQQMKHTYRSAPSDSLLYDILLAQYGLTGYYLEEDHDDKAEEQLKEAERFLKKLEGKPDYEVQHMLFRAAFKAFHINLRPRRGMSLGPRSSRLIDKVLEKDENCARGHLEKGNMLYHAPRLMGGSKKRSVDHYAKAVELWGNNLPDNHRWLYLNTLVKLATAQKETGGLDQAITTLEKALQFEPEFRWVRDELLPEWR